MNIAFLSPEYVTEKNFSGGLANYLSRISLCLTNAGHSVRIFVLSDRTGSFHENGSEIILVNFKPFKFQRLSKTLNILKGAHLLKNATLKSHKENKIDIIQSTNFRAPAYFLLKSNTIPIVTRLSSFTPFWRAANDLPSYADEAISERLEITAIRQSIGVYSPSALLPKLVNLVEPIHIDHIYPPFYAPDTSESLNAYNQLQIKNKYLLFFGTLAKVKGVDFLLRNLHQILNDNPDISFVFVGKHGNESQLKNAASHHSQRVHYLNALRNAELKPFIANAKAIILPSRLDNLPNTCLESMAMGKVVLTTYSTGLENIIVNENNGFIINYDDDFALRESINKICALSDERLKEIGQQAKKTISDTFDPKTNTEKLINYLLQKINLWKSHQTQKSN